MDMFLSNQCESCIQISVFDGSGKSNFQKRRELTGPLLTQLDDACNFMDRYNRTRSEFSGLDRIDRRDYPTEALREALVYAMIHRDYTVKGDLLIHIFDDRIEIVTIGGSALKNKQLAHIFQELHLTKACGTGIEEIQKCYGQQKVKPQMEVSSHAFKITLPNLNFPPS